MALNGSQIKKCLKADRKIEKTENKKGMKSYEY